jgi:hypothetical protein
LLIAVAEQAEAKPGRLDLRALSSRRLFEARCESGLEERLKRRRLDANVGHGTGQRVAVERIGGIAANMRCRASRRSPITARKPMRSARTFSLTSRRTDGG